ncbi:MAG: 16S rRNA (cytosine(967)-C(5))-methyltransferase RsmB [Clostridia bacterium]|nr:16S rRNA (cytosine(967)-C(5))-methyltransferase RsmB [Clostridia bacterium]
MDDRFIAYKILSKIERDKAYSNIAVDTVLNQNEVSSAPFVCALVYGVIERKITLDYYLSQFLTQPIKKLNPQVLTILRMGVYQLKYMDKVPVSAAVNESVKLSKKVKCAFASGLINSILRKVASTEILLPNTDNKIYDLSIAYSCPESLVSHFVNDYDYIKTEEILKASVGTVPVYLRVNTLKIKHNDLIAELAKEGITAKALENGTTLEIIDGGAVFKTDAYKKGYFHAQDLASQECIDSLAPQKNDVVFDMCAAPGGKSFAMAEMMENQGEIYSFDLYDHKIKLINDGAKRLDISVINAQIGDASVYNPDLPKADKILCDVPCAGLGVIRRKPEIKYKDFSFVDKLCELQYNILENSAKYLKEKGVIMYSTCSLSNKENAEVCERFLHEHKEFKNGGMVTLFPQENGSDGFFYAKLIKE